ncbi:MAG: amidophosphoribosyltransferase [Bdellovibrionota bacterium]|jgi:amidophosphoribosyltransferase|nr:amidophosphoribosyltransferase [Bdellovibrionota bacterium]
MCGVIGVIGSYHEDKVPFWAAYEAYRGLLTLQHRGQDAAGVLSYDKDRRKFYGKKNLGLVSQALEQEDLEACTGNMAVAHTRYATVGTDGVSDLQPMVAGFPFGVGMVHNGNILNYHSLAKKLGETYDFQLLTNNDLELMLHLWCQKILEERETQNTPLEFRHIKEAAKSIFKEANGAYALVGLMANVGLFALRDPNGIRPLVLGKREGEKGDEYCVASESLALNFLGFEFVRDIQPGEVILITQKGEVISEIVGQAEKVSHCMFEWIYFAGAESTMEEKSVYSTRLNLGRVLADKVKASIESGEISPDFVCPVPDTSRTASISLAESLKMPYREGLIKNRYIQRSFILNTQDKREKAVALKLSPVQSEIKDKNILLVDDSVVRGTTSQKIIELLKKNGAREITLAITCPPLRYGCFYGIDFPKGSELIANGRDLEEIAKWVGANKVIYLDEEDLEKAIGTTKLCMACVTNKYPTDVEEGKTFAQMRRS